MRENQLIKVTFIILSFNRRTISFSPRYVNISDPTTVTGDDRMRRHLLFNLLGALAYLHYPIQ